MYANSPYRIGALLARSTPILRSVLSPMLSKLNAKWRRPTDTALEYRKWFMSCPLRSK